MAVQGLQEHIVEKIVSGEISVQRGPCEEMEVERDNDAVVKTVHEHKKMLSGDVLWCSRCGVYADKKAKGVVDSCRGKPPKGGGGRMEGQLRKLRNHIHPKTRGSDSLANGG